MRSALNENEKSHLVFKRAVPNENHMNKYWWSDEAMSQEDLNNILPNICG